MRSIRFNLHMLATLVLLLPACAPPLRKPPAPTGTPTPISGPEVDAAARKATQGDALPPTRREAVVETIHGAEVKDPYRWLETIDGPGVRDWLMAQDRYGRRRLARLPGRDLLAARLKALSYVEWISAPQRRGKRWFFARQHADKEKVVYYYRDGEKGEAKILLDPNAMSKDGSVSIRGISISRQGERVAYKLSKNNADESVLHVMEVGSRKVSAIDRIDGVKYAHPVWTPKGDGFYYTRLPTDKSIKVAERPGYAQILFHKLGEDPKKDRLIHDKTGDPKTFIGADLSRDGRWLFVYIYHGWTRTDVYFRDLQHKKSKLRPFAVGRSAKFEIVAWKGRFFVLTNEGAPRWRLFSVDPRRVARRSWKEIVPEQRDAVLQSFSVRGNHLSLQYLRNAASELRVARLSGKVLRTVKLPGIGNAQGLVGNPEDDVAYYSFSSFVAPPSVYRTTVRRGESTLYFRMKVPADPSPYMVEQVHYPSKDGTQISMFIIRRKDLKKDGSTPFLLYGYGGFNISLTPRYRGEYFAWLEQGAAVAIPNLRGGGEYGEAWHEAGMLTRKQNVFDDFIAAAEYLIKAGYTKTTRLAIRGGSNGGLLVGAAMTQRPDLFRAVACHVPLLDMVRYHLFGSGKTWIAEYGSADDPTQFKALYAYSPYHHVKEKTAYPALLMMSADSDDRVDPMHARKFVAAIQHASISGHPVWMRVETHAGHGGGDMIKKKVEARADEYAFLLKEIGVTPRAQK